MPGPVSDAYDPEFSTQARATAVREAMQEVDDAITEELGPALADIVQVAQGEGSKLSKLQFNDRHLRIIRFSIRRAMESM